jgi:hypothetical protein
VRRAFVSLLAVGLLFLIPQAAHSVDDVSIEVLSAPPANSVLRGDEAFPFVIRARADSTLKSFAVAIFIAEQPVPGMQVHGGSASGSWAAGAETEATFQINWDTQKVTPYNGRYRVGATAESHLGGVRNISIDGYVVDNPPAQVTEVQAELKDDNPSLSWKPNSEPDLIGYQIFRAGGGSAYKKIASGSATTFTDKEAPKDIELKYYVVAARRSVASNNGSVVSSPSMVRSFTIPSPGSGQQPVISAPQEAPAAPPVPKVVARPPAKITHQGFEEMLPYTEGGEAGQIPFPVGDQDLEADQRVFKAPPALGTMQVYKPPFLAAALLLLAAAAHMIRLAITLFSAGTPRRTSDSPLAAPASSS